MSTIGRASFTCVSIRRVHFIQHVLLDSGESCEPDVGFANNNAITIEEDRRFKAIRVQRAGGLTDASCGGGLTDAATFGRMLVCRDPTEAMDMFVPAVHSEQARKEDGRGVNQEPGPQTRST